MRLDVLEQFGWWAGMDQLTTLQDVRVGGRDMRQNEPSMGEHKSRALASRCVGARHELLDRGSDGFDVFKINAAFRLIEQGKMWILKDQL